MVRSNVHAAALIAAAVAATGAASTAFGQANGDAKAKTLSIGDKAPAIDIEHWVKGDKVAKFEDGKVYVVEFWATWCGPCRLSMPHLSGLQKQYKDYGVTFIGVSDEPLETVTGFLPKADKDGKTWNEKIEYTLTTDPDASVKKDYFIAANQRGIPCAFVVGKDQKIEWIGNPIYPEGDIDKAIEGVVKGTWNRDAYKDTWEKQQAAEREAEKSMMVMRQAYQAKDWKKVTELLDAQIAKDPKALGPRMQKFTLLIGEMDQPKEGYALGEEIAKDNWEDATVLNALAWPSVGLPSIKTKNADFALKLSEQANKLTNDKDSMIQDTLARCHHEKGDLRKAVETQKKAVANLPADVDARTADQIKATLKQYEDELAAGKK